MKHILHYIYVLLAGLALLPATAQGIRISSQEFSIRNDSLQIVLEMDLNDVHVNSLTAVSFTLVLQAVERQETVSLRTPGAGTDLRTSSGNPLSGIDRQP